MNSRDVDIPLTEKGVMEAIAGGKALSHIEFDVIFTSRLVRSKQTALIAMTQVITQLPIRISRNWSLKFYSISSAESKNGSSSDCERWILW